MTTQPRHIPLLSHLLLWLCLLSSGCMFAQSNGNAYQAYFNRYHRMAVEQMAKYSIPASITLAQGVFESAAGRSRLATVANNHFGIKAGSTWTGPVVYADDDAPSERFRKYRSVAESYEDHSLFLVRNKRYAGLFRLSRRDYKGWARGLKSAGYATNPRYAEQLINIIEAYRLDRYDHLSLRDVRRQTTASQTTAPIDIGQIGCCNGSCYVRAQRGQTLRDIARNFDISERRLRKYNEVPKGYKPAEGEIIYLEKKRSKADKSLKHHIHIVRPGETFHTIAQRYGIRLKTLYKNNGLTPAAHIQAGQGLLIR